MVETVDKAGEGMRELRAVAFTPPGDHNMDAGEWADTIAGVPRSEIV